MVDSEIFISNVSLADFLIFIFLFIGALLLSNFLTELIRKLFKKRLGSKYKIPARILQYLLVFSVTYYGLSNILGFDFRAFFAAFGIMGIVVAFSAQQTIQNILGGTFIFFGGIIKLDDWVEASGLPSTEMAQVKDISLTRTTLREISGRVITLPNSVFVTSKLVRYPRGDFFRATFDLKVSSKTEVDKVNKIINDICSKNEKILPNIPRKEKRGLRRLLKSLPGGHDELLSFLDKKIDTNRFEPEVFVKEIGGDFLNLEIRIWIWEIRNKEKIISSLMEELTEQLPKKGVKLV